MKKRFSLVSIKVISFIISALVFISGGFSMSYADDIASEETEEGSELIAYKEFPEAEVTDVWQIDEENGEDPIVEHDSMGLMDTYTYDASFETEISVFPESYKAALRRIHTMYPNFEFVADDINMTLDTAVREQIENGYKTYSSVYTDDYDTIRKFMDPLTYLYPEYDERYDVYSDAFNPSRHVDADFFMFADHSYSTNQYGEALQNIVGFPDDPPSMQCDFLVNEDMNSIIAASAKCSMNPYVMASTVILEKGWNAAANGNADVTGRVVNKGHVSEATIYSSAGGSGVLGTVRNTDVYIVAGGDTTTSDGKTWLKIIFDSDGNLFDSKVRGVPGFIESARVTDIAYFNTYYNLFSINQTDNNPVVGGIAYAMSHGWTSLAASFEGGAEFCKDYYYDNDQYTYYYMHYNVLNPTSNWWHEYSTGVSAGLKCARILRYGYDYDHYQYLVLHIPVYNPEPEMAPGWNQIDGDMYYKWPNGDLARGWNEIGNDWYYFNAAGIMQTGWVKPARVWYYLDEDGKMVTGWQEIEGDWYYFNSNGAMQTGWIRPARVWYYLDDEGIMLTGWQEIEGDWYYFNSNGAMQTRWIKTRGVWYFLDGSGRMIIGWKEIQGDWYYFNAEGAMQTGWISPVRARYYLDEDGKMVTGWQEIEGDWYYFNAAGAMQTGWVRPVRAWYYLDSSGKMVTGWQVIEGKQYYFNSSGALQGNR